MEACGHKLRRGQLHGLVHTTRRNGHLIGLMLGAVIFGGVGAGLYGMLVFVILSVFIAGLMVGRTPGIWVRRSKPTT